MSNLTFPKNYSHQVVVYPYFSDFLGVKKNKPSEPTHGKIVGLGGKVEAGESLDGCIRREMTAELVLACYDFHNQDYEFRGMLIRHDKKRKIFIYTANLHRKIEEVYAINEGPTMWLPKYYHKSHPEYFLVNDLAFLDHLFFTNESIFTEVDKEGFIIEAPNKDYIGLKAA